MMDKKLKAVVCGAGFGQFYMEALSRMKDRIELVGLVAKGSEKSIKCAEVYEIPLFTSKDQIPEDIDIAFVILRSAMLGGAANEYTEFFFNRGVHVLQEFPIHPDDVRNNFRKARKNAVCFHVGDFYLHLPQIRKFTEYVKRLNEICPPSHIQMSLAAAVSMPALMMLRDMLPSANKMELKCVSDNETPFQVILGNIDGVPVTAEIHNEVNTDDPDSAMYLLQAFNVIYETGRLSLQDPLGDIFWYPKIKSSVSRYSSGAAAREADKDSGLKDGAVSLSFYGAQAAEKGTNEIWVQAIISDIEEMLEGITDKAAYMRYSQKTMTGTAQWESFNKLIGFPKRIDGVKASPEQKDMLIERITEFITEK
ncbi:Gfo/Idh/MocA family oxidoreductase [Ruminococcus flavefaciens]|uniref:Thiazolinyl imide reductase n=1 Tax=Ruminococcus flavefaciens TaxID=1265 RepID=A0A1M7K510_RUMFL|nr:Gfo/Idh/MocA family oxidoreductase [Ruminococcus flavefaciens]SHM60379.1 thiazolinyl imide reductase [Ruminococcus flavefaciens]